MKTVNYVEHVVGGEDFELVEGFVLHHPTLQEINRYGHEKYNYLVGTILSTPDDLMVQYDDQGIDFQTINWFDFTCQNIQSLPLNMLMMFEKDRLEDGSINKTGENELAELIKSYTSIIFGNIDLTQLKLKKEEVTGKRGLYYRPSDCFLDQSLIGQLVKFVRLVNCQTEKLPRNFSSDYVKQSEIRDERFRQMRLKNKQKEESVFPYYISVLVNTPGFKYDYETVKQIKIGQFYDALLAFNKLKEHNHIMDAIYAGTVDMKKMKDKTVLDLFKPHLANN